EAELWNGLHGKHRNVIRNAQNKGVVIRRGMDQLEIFYALYQSTMERSSLYAEPISRFRQLGEALGTEHLICAVAYYQEKPMGGVLMPYSIYGAYYVYGASASGMEVNGALNLLHWNLIASMKARGVKRYDFVGTRLSDTAGTRLAGIQQFKSRFGSALDAGVLWKMDLNKIKCRCYDMLVVCYWKMKGVQLKGDIIDQEISKSQE
ncbi:MAG TPA: peptidoglycan bridge formation glycyltransferase FemA/FemB family protein, partial [Bacteroidia bacterium]|nr:peptidoglycan bridge formation glycyltransferase FemA/FemB family protein [Bacteroidia bacterium]